MQSKIKNIHISQAIWAAVLALGLSFAIVGGWLYDETSFLALTPKYALLMLVLFVVLTVPFYLLLVRTTRDQAAFKQAGGDELEGKKASTREQSNQKSRWQPSKRDIWITIALMAIPQFILWLIAWPGVYSHDAPYIVFQMNPTPESQVPIGTRFSVVYTVFLGGLVRIGKHFGSMEMGFACAMFLQSCVLIYAQCKAAHFVGKESCSKIFFWVTVAFFALHPFGMVMRISACQDTLFYAFLLLLLLDAYRLGKSIFAGNDVDLKLMVHLNIVTILMCLFRNNGIFFYVIAVLFMLPVFVKKKCFKTFGLLLLPILIICVITGPVYKACGVVDSELTVQEMSSVPSQQFARSLANNPNSITEEDKAELDRFYNNLTGDYSWYWDTPERADAAKSMINQQSVKDDPLGFFKLYFKVGFKNIGNYRDAFLMNTLGWWYPFKSYPDSRMYHDYVKYETMEKLDYKGTFIKIERQSLFPQVDEFIAKTIKAGDWSRTPVLNLLLDTGSYIWIFFTLCAIAILNKRKDAAFAFIIACGLLLTYILCPLCYFRYSYAIIICIPVFMLVAFKPHCEKPVAIHLCSNVSDVAH